MKIIKCPCCEVMIEIRDADSATDSSKAIVVIQKDMWSATEYFPRWASFSFKKGIVLSTKI